MRTKEYLEQIHRLELELENESDELVKLKAMATSITAPTDNERVQSSGSKDRMGSIVAKYVDMEQEIDAKLEYIIGKRKHIIKQIASLDNSEEYHVLNCRYVRNMTFDSIANRINYSTRQVTRIHGRALKEFEKRFGEEYLNI